MSEGFDTKVHHRDSKTGRINKVTAYKLKVTREGSFYIRDGVEYFPNNDVKYDPKAQHKDTQEAQKKGK